MSIREPVKGHELKLELLNIEDITIPSIQRDISETLVRNLAKSIDRVGFVDPILVIPSEDGRYEVINGQHRLQAMKFLGMDRIPAIVLPKEIKHYIINLNVEKAPNLKDKAHQAYEIFMEYLGMDASLRENELADKIDLGYYITVGFVVDRFGDRRFPAYAFERVLQKVDDFTELPLKEAETERESRANVLMKAKEVLNRRYEELGLRNALNKEAIVSKAFQMVYGKRVRMVEDDFYTAFEKIMEAIPNVSIVEEEF